MNDYAYLSLTIVDFLLLLVARGFIARRRVQKRRVEAEKQARLVNELLTQISGLAVSYHEAQVQKISDDAKIPKGT